MLHTQLDPKPPSPPAAPSLAEMAEVCETMALQANELFAVRLKAAAATLRDVEALATEWEADAEKLELSGRSYVAATTRRECARALRRLVERTAPSAND